MISGNVNYSSLSRVDTNNIHYNTQCWETYEKVKVFEIIESKKVRGNVKDPFGLKRFFFSYKYPRGAAFYISSAKYLKTRRYINR